MKSLSIYPSAFIMAYVTYRAIFMGLVAMLVQATVFKTACEARVVSGGFDSHTVPPNNLTLSYYNLANW